MPFRPLSQKETINFLQKNWKQTGRRRKKKKVKKMLTTKQIERIAEEGWEIILKKRLHPKGYCGWCLPNEKEIRIYLPQLIERDSLPLTLLHELIHVRDEETKNAARNSRSDWDVEAEAEKTYKRNPKIINFIVDFYSLDVKDYLRKKIEKEIEKLCPRRSRAIEQSINRGM